MYTPTMSESYFLKYTFCIAFNIAVFSIWLFNAETTFILINK